MKVSVIIPGFRFEYLQEVFDSISKQTKQPYEVLYSFCKEKDPGLKVNEMLNIATGDAIILLGDDDRLAPDFIKKTTEAMEKENVDIVYTDMLKFGPEGSAVQPASEYNWESFRVSTVPWFTSLVKRKVFFKVGGWDREQDYQDYDFYLRAFKAGYTACCIHEPLFEYRVHPGSGSNAMDHSASRAKLKAKHPEIL